MIIDQDVFAKNAETKRSFIRYSKINIVFFCLGCLLIGYR